jgi:hypothetical protein
MTNSDPGSPERRRRRRRSTACALYTAILTEVMLQRSLAVGLFLPPYRRSGTTGATTRPNVELITAANEAYQAAMAVARPT